MTTLLAFGFGGSWEWIILLFVALMLFGKRLPEVARNMGKGLTEFKKGIRGVEDEVHSATSYDPGYDAGPTAQRPSVDDSLENVSAPKFEPPTPATDVAADESPDDGVSPEPDTYDHDNA
tara:strand:+ start:666 stop:1025 length:360 start_codon:yes stop_codon:yes gene_type:complete